MKKLAGLGIALTMMLALTGCGLFGDSNRVRPAEYVDPITITEDARAEFGEEQAALAGEKAIRFALAHSSTRPWPIRRSRASPPTS